MADVLGHDWVLLAEEGVGLRPALATVPSVTEVSRTSLLTGKLAQGHAPNEKVGFAEHPALLKTCRTGFPPCSSTKRSCRRRMIRAWQLTFAKRSVGPSQDRRRSGECSG